MRLHELFESKLGSEIKDAILVMISRSKTVGEPYELSYSQLTRMMDYPGVISKSDIEAALADNPTLADAVVNFDNGYIEVSGQAAEAQPSDELDMEMPADLPVDDMAAAPEELPTAAGQEAAPPEETEEPVYQDTTVQQMADRAAKRRSK